MKNNLRRVQLADEAQAYGQTPPDNKKEPTIMIDINWRPDSFALPFPDDDDIRSMEKHMWITSPQDYKDFLQHYGGGDPTYASFMGDGHDWCIDRFLCILRDFEDHPLGCYDIEVVWAQLEDRLGSDGDRLGAELLPIVALFAGDFLCLDYRETTTNPPLVVWLHEESEPDYPVTRPVCATFTEFLELLHYNTKHS